MPRQAFEVVRYVYGAPNKLQDVMRWALSDPAGFIPQVVADVVVQDELTQMWLFLRWQSDLVSALGAA